MTESSFDYNIGAIRELLLAAFTAKELRRFCQDHPLFRPIIEQFGSGSSLQDMVDRTIDYCETRVLFDQLLAEIQEQNPRRYVLFQRQLFAPSQNAARTSSIEFPLLSLGTAPPRPISFVGRDDALTEMKTRVIGRGRTSVITAVHGWPGVGKTTLAAALVHEGEIEDAFPDGILWTTLGPDATPNLSLGTWLTEFGIDPYTLPTIEQRSNRLAALLRSRRVLLVIDDVWDASQAYPFCVGGRGCHTLISTRNPEAVRGLGLPNHAIYRLEVLSQAHGMELLQKLAPRAVELDPHSTERLVQELEGLPLALQVAGRLLSAEIDMGWGIQDLVEELREGNRILEARAPADRVSLIDQTTPTIATLLQRSTDRLDEVTRDRFALLGAFVPTPATFDIDAAAALWCADNPRPTLRKLVDRGLLEPAGGGRFRMHALLVMHARALCEN